MALNESKLGCSFLKRVFNKRNDVDGTPRIDFVKTINFFEDRFMSQEDKQLLIRIMKSSVKGEKIQVKK